MAYTNMHTYYFAAKKFSEGIKNGVHGDGKALHSCFKETVGGNQVTPVNYPALKGGACKSYAFRD